MDRMGGSGGEEEEERGGRQEGKRDRQRERQTEREREREAKLCLADNLFCVKSGLNFSSRCSGGRRGGWVECTRWEEGRRMKGGKQRKRGRQGGMDTQAERQRGGGEVGTQPTTF